MPAKERLDVLLVQRGLAESRTKAQALIRAGDVSVAGHRSDKPGLSIALDAQITMRERSPWVGRGALKLVHALDAFGIDVREQVCLDVGASTGGFTDVLLARGADHVFAVDVGRNQLAWRLRQDARVTCMERTDIRRLDSLPTTPTVTVVDVAFIALRSVLPPIQALCPPGSDVIALVKPQFEAGRERVGRGGIVRDAHVHRSVLRAVIEQARDARWRVIDATASPITGGSGNREFLLQMATPNEAPAVRDMRSTDADIVVDPVDDADDGRLAKQVEDCYVDPSVKILVARAVTPSDSQSDSAD